MSRKQPGDTGGVNPVNDLAKGRHQIFTTTRHRAKEPGATRSHGPPRERGRFPAFCRLIESLRPLTWTDRLSSRMRVFFALSKDQRPSAGLRPPSPGGEGRISQSSGNPLGELFPIPPSSRRAGMSAKADAEGEVGCQRGTAPSRRSAKPTRRVGAGPLGRPKLTAHASQSSIIDDCEDASFDSGEIGASVGAFTVEPYAP